MKLAEAGWQRSGELRHLIEVLGGEAGESRFVGGCVRDTLLGLPVSDIDIATRLLPPDVLDRLGSAGIKAVPTGLAHGTVTAVLAGKPVEITTLRRDVSTDGRHATVAYTDDWREDAARRDFTMNALSADPVSLEVFDYFGGEEDIRARRVRFIGDPLQRIAEDHLRILRYFRFHARFGDGEPDGPALQACTARANDLMALSRERIAGELIKLLTLPSATETLRLMQDKGILAPVLPEIDPESVARLGRLVARETLLGLQPDPVRRLAALLPQDVQAARDIGARLKLSNGWRARLEEYAVPGERVRRARHLAYCVGVERALDLLLLDDIPDEALQSDYAALQGWEPPSFPLKGGDLIAMGLPKGPIVAKTLHELTTAWCEAGFPAAEKVRELARSHVDQALRDRQ